MVQVVEDVAGTHSLQNRGAKGLEESRVDLSEVGIRKLVFKLGPAQGVCVVGDEDVQELDALADAHEREVISVVSVLNSVVKDLLSCDGVWVELSGDRIEEVEGPASEEDSIDLVKQGVEVFVACVVGDRHWSQSASAQEDVVHLCDVVASSTHQCKVLLRSGKSHYANCQWHSSLILR